MLWKAAPDCSEPSLREIAVELSEVLRSGDWVLLEGPLGTGKSTFAGMLLQALGIKRPPEGSPTFAIVHEYLSSAIGKIAHIDFYRLKDENEIEDAGLTDHFWGEAGLVIAEWASAFPGFEKELVRSHEGRTLWRVELGFAGAQDRRNVRITRQI